MKWIGAIKTEAADGEQRYAHRHSLLLMAQASADGAAARAVIHNLSSTGLLIEAELPVEVGDEVSVDLPYIESKRAIVVWSSENFHGCEFDSPVSEAIVSAARLRSAPAWQTDAMLEENEAAEPRDFSFRQMVLIIVLIIASLALASWGVVIGAVWLMLKLF